MGNDGPAPWQIGDLGLRRKAPKGWLPARAYAVTHKVKDDPWSGSGGPEGDRNSAHETSTRLEVRWEVDLPGHERYQFDEVRKSPVWLKNTGDVPFNTGDRFYKWKVRPSFGFTAQLGVPCVVNPKDLTDLWVDWDQAYKEHEPAWEQRAAVELEVARRSNALEHGITRILSPFARKLRPDEEHLVEAELARRKEQEDRETEAALAKPIPETAYSSPVAADEVAANLAKAAEAQRIYSLQHPGTATVVSCTQTEQLMVGHPVWELQLDVVGPAGAFRAVLHEVLPSKRQRKRYAAGAQIQVWLDPADPSAVALG